MLFKDTPIQKKLMRIISLMSGVVLFVTCTTFFVYQLYTFQNATLEKVNTIGKILSTNTTAALAFGNKEEAKEILEALRSEPHIITAALYGKDGKLFAGYSAKPKSRIFPLKPQKGGYNFTITELEGYYPVVENTNQVGILYLKSDLGVMYDGLKIYGLIILLVISLSMFLSFFFSKILQKNISEPIITLAGTAKVISDQGDYSVRAVKRGGDELGSLTDAFNHMLVQIEEQNQTMNEFNQNLEQKVLTRTAELKDKEEKISLQNWILQGISDVDDILRGEKETCVLSQDIINKLASLLNAQVGAIYLTENPQELKFIAGYAFSKFHQTHRIFKFGQGLIGQAALEKKSILLSHIPEDYIKINSSLGEMSPKNVFVMPLIYADGVIGVIELGTAEDFTSLQIEFLEQVALRITIAINSSQSRFQLKELLEETKSQSDELQKQQEELKQYNEELQNQTQKLKQQQEELQITNEELEKQSQSLELKNIEVETARADIEQKTKQLEISSKFKSEFLANMSHELRTPLNSLLILSKDLAENKTKNLTRDQVESADIINKSGYDLLGLINETLDLVKIESGKMTLNIERITINDIVNNLNRNFRHQTDAKGIKLNISLGKELPETILTDLRRLDQIIKNLMSNAIKFTEDGSISVDFERHDENSIVLSVTDTGIGITEEKQSLVFEAFHQGDGSTSRKYGGTGLGLSISRELAKLLQGELKLTTSKMNEGSIFTLMIPIELTEKVVAINSDTHKEPTVTLVLPEESNEFINYPTIADDRQNIKVNDKVLLVIEDDLKFAEILLKQSHDREFKCLLAGTGEDGLLLVEKYKPHAIILDLNLPGMIGRQVLAELKSNPSLRHIPVHIISDEDKTIEIIKEGAKEYFRKPIDKKQLEELFNRIDDFISRKIKNLLIIEDDDNSRKAIKKIIGNGDVKFFEAGDGKEAITLFKENYIDCAILDLKLPDISGFELIHKLEKAKNGHMPPIIVYTGKELTKEENEELLIYAETIIIKGAKSEERLLDETSLFLHRTISNLPESKQKIIDSLYDKEIIFQRKKILLVDDDMRNIFALSKILQERGMEVIKAENGKIALEILDKNPIIDLVLMDIMMPEMDGYEAMRKIRAQGPFKKLPVIALTAKAMKEDKQRCIDAGANDYVTKPIDLDRLLSLMRVWLSK